MQSVYQMEVLRHGASGQFWNIRRTVPDNAKRLPGMPEVSAGYFHERFGTRCG